MNMIMASDIFDKGFQQSSQPWWRIKLFVWEPVLFGTWDGVFTTCMINIFGVVLFLRTGYLVVSVQTLFSSLYLSSINCGFIYSVYFGHLRSNIQSV